MKRLLIAAGLSLVTAACSSPEPEAPANTTGSTENVAAVVAALEPAEQRGVLFRAIRDAGLPCQEVTEMNEESPMGGSPVWRARCDTGQYHLVQISPDGTATVISRTGN